MFKGSNVALVTPFKNDKLDDETYINLIHFHIQNGTNGLVPAGTTGESPTLSHDEHERVIELCVKESNGKLPVFAGTGITVNTNDIATNDGEIVHDNLSGFVANEHIDHSGVSITAGIGLAGGGTIASTRDLAIDSAELLAYFGGTKGFDADKLDGQHGSHYRINVYNAAGSLLN